MIQVVNCPHCHTQLSLSVSERRTDILCLNCHSRYWATFAVLSQSNSYILPARTNSEKTQHVYDLRILVQGQVQSLDFRISAQREFLSFLPNDELLLLHTRSKQQLALVKNRTKNWTVPLVVTQKGHIGQLITVVAGVSVLGFALGSNFLQGIVPEKYAPFVGLGLTTPISVVLLNKRRRPSFIETDARTIAQLSRTQMLLQEQTVLQIRLQELEQDRNYNVALQQQNTSLITSQVNNNPQMGERVSTLSRAQVLLKQNAAVIQQLIEGYKWKLERLQIDLSASQLADSLPENQLIDISSELEQLEWERQEIKAQISLLSNENA